MTYIRTVGDDEAEGKIARAYEEARKQGGVYETTRLLSAWPEAMRSEQRRYQTVMLDETELTRAEKEMIATVVSVKNRCRYCHVHHMAAMIEAGVDAARAEAIRDDHRAAEIDDKTRAMLDYALTERPDQTSEADVDRLRGLGWTDRQILEMIIVAGLFEDYNLRVSMFGLELEDWT